MINDQFHFHNVIEDYTEILGSIAEVTYPLFNHRCYELAREMGVTALLSGFGGDEMVSQHATARLHELRAKKAYLHYCYEWVRSKKKKYWLTKLGLLPRQSSTLIMPTVHFPYLRMPLDSIQDDTTLHFPTVKSFEFALIQGALSTHFNRRIVTSTIIAEHYGIKHHFPLTNPAFMQFFYSLPSHMKRRHGKGRYLMRQAMRNFLPANIVWRDDKAGATVPAAWNNFTTRLPQLFMERISPDHRGICADFVDIAKLTHDIENYPNDTYGRGMISLAVSVMMLAHLERWLNVLFSKKAE